MEKVVKDYLEKFKRKDLMSRELYNLLEVTDEDLLKKFETMSLYDFKQQYCDYIYDGKNKKYYKKVPCNVTDEEYEKILKVNNSKNYKEMILGNVFKYVGIGIFILGLIVGIYAGQQNDSYFDDEFKIGIASIIWGSSFISGMLLLGMGQIINLLDDIRNKK